MVSTVRGVLTRESDSQVTFSLGITTCSSCQSCSCCCVGFTVDTTMDYFTRCSPTCDGWNLTSTLWVPTSGLKGENSRCT